MHHRNRLLEEFARAEAGCQTPLVFMHSYPGDLAADGNAIAQSFADAHGAFVDTGHTHYNELLNDGRVIYGATRSTGQIEEGGGKPGFALVTLHGRVPSWRFKETGGAWPFVQIVAPADIRVVTRPADPQHFPTVCTGDAATFGLAVIEPGSLASAVLMIAGVTLIAKF